MYGKRLCLRASVSCAQKYGFSDRWNQAFSAGRTRMRFDAEVPTFCWHLGLEGARLAFSRGLQSGGPQCGGLQNLTSPISERGAHSLGVCSLAVFRLGAILERGAHSLRVYSLGLYSQGVYRISSHRFRSAVPHSWRLLSGSLQNLQPPSWIASPPFWESTVWGFTELVERRFC